jgi:cytochrome bd-type quinol oxidase subunit 2
MELFLFPWFLIIGIMVTVYIVAGGTHLGYGMWYLFAPHITRDCYLRALKPHINGSELWLLMAGSALYIVFPRVYRVVVVGFYPIVFLLVAFMIFRIIALSLRNLSAIVHWQSLWDVGIGLSSSAPMFLKGLIVGYILKGIPLYETGQFNVNLLGYINHYTIVTGLLTMFVSATMGSAAIAGNSTGIAQINARKWGFYSSLITCVLFVDLSIWSLIVSPYVSSNIRENPALFLIPGLVFAAAVSLPFLIAGRKYVLTYTVSVFVMAGITTVFFVSIFPHLKTIFYDSQEAALTAESYNRLHSFAEIHPVLILSVYLFLMAATALAQFYIFRALWRPSNCPLPYDDEDDTLV